MKINNHDIELIYKYFHNELDSQEHGYIKTRLTDDPDFKQEFNFQQNLFDQLNHMNMPLENIKDHLEKHHDQYKLRAKWMKLFPWIIIGGILIIIIGVGLFPIISHGNKHDIEKKVLPEINISISDSMILNQPDSLTTIFNQMDESNNTGNNLTGIEKEVVIQTIHPIDQLFIKEHNGQLLLKGIDFKQFSGLIYINHQGQNFVRIDDKLYRLTDSGYNLVKDIRLLQKLNVLSETDLEITARLKHYEFDSLGTKLILFKKGKKDLLKINENRNTIEIMYKNGLPEKYALLDFNNKLYLQLDTSFFILKEDNFVRIGSSPIQHQTTNKQLNIHVFDGLKFDEFNEN